MKPVRIGALSVGDGHPLVLIAGPCVIEGEALTRRLAEALVRVAGKLGIPFIFKASYDKANRTSHRSFRGIGREKGLAVLRRIRDELEIPVLTDVHSPEEARQAAACVDVLQIPAFLSRQTDLLVAAGGSGRVVNVKKGQFLAPWDMAHVVAKLRHAGARGILLTERGTSFGYNNLVVDMRSIPVMRSTGCPVVMDATHGVQLPGGKGTCSGGEAVYAPIVARAAVAAGADAVFLETHPDPSKALSDGPNMIPLKNLAAVVEPLIEIRELVQK